MVCVCVCVFVCSSLIDCCVVQVLDEANKLHFLGAPGDHLQFTDEWFVDNIVPFLKQS